MAFVVWMIFRIAGSKAESGINSCHGRRQAGAMEAYALDVQDRQPGGIEPADPVIHAVDAGLAPPDRLRLEAAVAVPRHRHRQSTVPAFQHLASPAVSAIGLTGRGSLTLSIARMRGRLRLPHPFRQTEFQFFHQPGVAEKPLGAVNALQMLVPYFPGDRHSCVLSPKHGPDRSYTDDRTLSVILRMSLDR